jgi:two-component system cell cycle sensor histidine kinase/response regulator CckA
MPANLNVLVVEDSEDDSRLSLRELERAGYEISHVRTDTEAALRAALAQRRWDLVLSDYNVPGFGGPAALAIVRELHPMLPFIFVSGTIGEETAVAAMRAGANDYVMKGNLKRLVPAIERELREAAVRLERQGLESQLRQSQKMEAIGRLAGGVAHDFNNLLTAIMGYGQLMAVRMKPDDPARHDTEEILKAATRAALLTRQLLAFSRREIIQPRLLDLNVIVSEMGKMLRRLIGESIDLAVVPGENLWAVKADPGHMEQVLMNLSVNARDAMREGGRLTIETSNIDLGGVYVGEHVGVKPGAYVLLAVSDTGTGMDEETKAQIFEPFFTTKGPESGTGLGLSTVYGIVQQWEGAIQVYTEVGWGSSFKVYLPRAAGTAEPVAQAGNLTEVPRGSETVLLVEDQDAVAAVIKATLHLCGYRVLEAHNGSEALALLERHDGPLHLLVTDIVMPMMGGSELAGRLREFRPETRVLFISGFSERAYSAHGGPDTGFAYLQKPFMPESLARKVREVLDASGTTANDSSVPRGRTV